MLRQSLKAALRNKKASYPGLLPLLSYLHPFYAATFYSSETEMHTVLYTISGIPPSEGKLWKYTAVFDFKGHGDIPKYFHGLNAVFLKLWSPDHHQQHQHLEACLISPTLDLLNQKFWSWGPTI